MTDQNLAQSSDAENLPDYQAKITQLERSIQEHLDGWKRAKADYLNLKRQSEKEKDEIAQFAQAAAVLRFIPIYDNLKRSIRHVPTEQANTDWVKGIAHIQKQFEDILKSLGIEPILTDGQPFDPHLHHAVHKIKQDGAASGTIVEELRSGFKLGDRVLEPAQVTVAE